MATRSVYCPEASTSSDESVIVVDGDEHRHLGVSRIRIGEEVEVFDGCGTVWAGTIVETLRDRTRIRIGSRSVVPRRQSEIVLAQALVRSAAFDWILEKAVELGVSRIVPLRAERSNETGRGRERRWRRIVVEATKQSKQYYVPKLDPVCGLEQVLAIEATSKVVFAESGGGSLKTALGGSPVVCLVGPEGGWTESETDRMREQGFDEVHLGEQILRAETAAILAVGLVAYELGVL